MEGNTYKTTYAERLSFTNETRDNLAIIVKWTRFLSILSFVLLGLSALMVILMGVFIGGANRYMEGIGATYYNPGTFSWMYAIIALIMIAVYCIPVYFLYQFSAKTRKALRNNDEVALSDGFRSLRNHYMIIGIFVIVGLVVYILSFLFMIISFATVM